MKRSLICMMLFISMSAIYPNPKLPTIFINEFGFTEKGWVIELWSAYWPENSPLYLTSSSGISDTFYVHSENYGFTIVTADSVNNSINFNPNGDRITISGYTPFNTISFGTNDEYSLADTLKMGQSICCWTKTTGRVLYYIDNTPTFGAKNTITNGMGKLTGIVKDSLGNAMPNVKVYYDYESFYGAGDIYVTTNDSGYFYINHFAERVSLRFKRTKFFDEKLRIQIYPDSTVSTEIILRSNQLSDVGEDEGLFSFSLKQNYPNPFNPVTKIQYSIPQSGNGEMLSVKLVIYDILGNEAEVLVNKEQYPGEYEIEFDGSSLTSGVYIYTLKTDKQMLTQKMCLIK